jgi:hypothetical protein
MLRRKADGAEVQLRVKLTVKALPEPILKAAVLLVFERSMPTRLAAERPIAPTACGIGWTDRAALSGGACASRRTAA